jgi:vacuolar-type H+-ATPase subunit E/Vma4
MEQEKLAKHLLDSISHQSSESMTNLLEDFEQQRTSLLEKYRKEANEEANLYIEQELFELKNRLIQNESQSKWKIKKDLFIKRTQLVNELMDSVFNDLLTFSNSADYKPWCQKHLLDTIKLDKSLDQGTIMVRSQDQALFTDLINALELNFKVEPFEFIHLGGFILKDKAGSVNYDATLDYDVKVQREWFTTHSKLDF